MRKCLKCSHLSTTMPDPDACPACGAVYAKVEAALQSRANPAADAPRSSAVRRDSRFGHPSGFAPAAARGEATVPFVKRLRAESVYPAFRTLVGVGTAAVVVIVLLVAVVSWFSGSTAVALSATSGAAIVVVVALAFREASLMLADMSDATIRMAQRQEHGNASDTL